MIQFEEKLHYLTVAKLYVLRRSFISSHNEDFYCLDCLNGLKIK